jgi:hypothetical protein
MTSNRAINSSFTQHNESSSSSSSLLQILIHEIAKDGGVTLVNSLPTSNPLISTHLNHNRNNKEKLKLVAFLKAYPHIFQVDDNNGNDPIVIVRLLEFELEFDSHTDREGKEFDKMKVEARKKLADKTMYELQKRLSKYDRRCKFNEKKEDCIGANNDADGNGNGDGDVASRPSRTLSEWATSNTIPGAQIEWLTKKVQRELHGYTRTFAKHSRPTGVVPYSNGWLAVVQKLYVDFLEEMCSCSCSCSCSSTGSSMGENASDAATARYIDCEALHGVSLSIQIWSSQIGQSRVHFVPMPNILEEDHGYRRQSQIENIANRIRSVLQNNAPPMGGIDFGKLLQDQQLRSLTGGMDVRKVMKECPGFFQGIRVFQDGNRGCGSKAGMTSSNDDHRNFTWYIEIVRETHASLHNRSKHEDLVEESTCPVNSRLAADEVGTYSLTKPRLATAMAKMLWRACKYGYLGKIDYKGSPTSDTALRNFSDEMVCIDITASVGGNTIAFAKAFSSVYAYEIDELREEYLRQNIASFLDAADRSKVVVECTDSMRGAIQK